MKIEKGQLIGGFLVLEVRDFLKRYRGFFEPEDVEEFFEIPLPRAQKFIRELIKAGFIERGDREGRFEATALGVRLRSVSGMKRMSREKVEMLLEGLLERAHYINDNPEFPQGIKTIVIFGSFMNPEARDYGDLDVAVDIRRKPGVTVADEDRQTYADVRAGRTPRFGYFWNSEKVARTLKGGKAGIHMVEFLDHQKMLENAPKKVYEFEL
jgi:predicted nucleotidyltransferase